MHVKFTKFHQDTSRSGDGFVTTNVSPDLKMFWSSLDILHKFVKFLCDVCFVFFEYKKFATYARKIHKIPSVHLESLGRIRNYECVPRSQNALDVSCSLNTYNTQRMHVKFTKFHQYTSRSGDGFVITNASPDLRMFWSSFGLLRKHITVHSDVCSPFFQCNKIATYARKSETFFHMDTS